MKFECSDELMCDAFNKGHINILNWWLEQKKKHVIRLYVCSSAVTQASANGHVAVLDWWMERYLNNDTPEVKYSSSSMDWANHTKVLDWWLDQYKKHGLPLKYFYTCNNTAWWKQNAAQLPPSSL